jgi:hypothetical protein
VAKRIVGVGFGFGVRRCFFVGIIRGFGFAVSF